MYVQTINFNSISLIRHHKSLLGITKSAQNECVQFNTFFPVSFNSVIKDPCFTVVVIKNLTYNTNFKNSQLQLFDVFVKLFSAMLYPCMDNFAGSSSFLNLSEFIKVTLHLVNQHILHLIKQFFRITKN